MRFNGATVTANSFQSGQWSASCPCMRHSFSSPRSLNGFRASRSGWTGSSRIDRIYQCGMSLTLKVRNLSLLRPALRPVPGPAPSPCDPSTGQGTHIFSANGCWSYFITDEGVTERGKGDRKLLALASKERLVRILEKMLDEREFLSEYGVRSSVLVLWHFDLLERY